MLLLLLLLLLLFLLQTVSERCTVEVGALRMYRHPTHDEKFTCAKATLLT